MKLLHQENQRFRFFQTENPDYPLHLHNAAEIVYIAEGSCEGIFQNKRIQLNEGDLFFAFPNRIHGYENSKEAKAFVFIIPMNPYLNIFGNVFSQKIPTSPVLRKEELGDIGIKEIILLAFSDAENDTDGVMYGYSLIIIGKILSRLKLENSKSTGQDALSATLIFLNENYRSTLTRNEIARAIGYNESHVSHIFSETLGTTLSDYIASLRINDALGMLSDTDQSISRIAMSLGFGSIRSFNRAFKKIVHITPSAFRRKVKNEKNL